MGIYDRDYYRRETSGSLWLTGQTPVTIGLVIANIVVYMADSLGFPGLEGGLLRWLVLMPSQVFQDFQFWRLLTATFCHAGLGHLFFNMLFLWWFGRELEKLYGSREFLIFYLVAAAFSSFLWALTTWQFGERQAAMVGASGAVTAVAVLYTLYNPRQVLLIYGIFPIEMRWMVLIYLGMDAMALMGSGHSAIAHMAHLGGAAYGVIFKYADLRVSRLLAPLRVRPRLRVVRPELDPSPPEQNQPALLDEALELKMDDVLAKIVREGQQSLTEQERGILEQASRRLRNRRG